MALFFSYVLTLLACLLAIPVFVFFVEIVAAFSLEHTTPRPQELAEAYCRSGPGP